MEVEIIKFPSDEDWLLARNNALSTRRKQTNISPNSKLKLKMILSEHSPLKDLTVTWVFKDIKYWIAMHLRTHTNGANHYISSQRNDMQDKYDRDLAPQSAFVDQRITANFIEILHISHLRLCNCASYETKMAWKTFLNELKPYAPELVSACVPTCIYRCGICSELYGSCGFNHTNRFQTELDDYLNLFKQFEKGD